MRLRVAILLLLACPLALGQGQANVAGTFYASNFGQWQVPQGNSGQFSWSAASYCTVTSGGTTFTAFKVGTPIYIADAIPANSEVVVPTAVSIKGSGCSIVVNPVNPHSSFTLQSATGGLQEAINYGISQNIPAVVITTPAWKGTTGTITSAVGITAVTILDERSAVIVPYTWNGSAYVADSFSGMYQLTQDVLAGPGGGSQQATVVGLRGYPLSCASLGANYVPVSVDGTTFTCAQLTLDQIAPAFAITNFTCSTCSSYEVGQTVASPTNFTASYTSTPVSASISDGTHTDNLSTPYTSGSLAYSYTLNSPGGVNYVLTAVGATTKTATQSSAWNWRTFYGVGTCGATSATVSGTSAVLNGGAGTIGTWGLGQNTGSVSVSPSSQCVYFLLSTNGHTFTVNGFGTAFGVNTVAGFTNQYSQSTTMYLYSSPVALSGTYSVVVN